MERFLVLSVYATQVLAGATLVAALCRRTPLTWASALARSLLLGPLALSMQMQAYHYVGVRFTLPAVLLPWIGLAGPIWLWKRRSAERAATSSVERLLLFLAFVVFGSALARGVQTPIYSSDAVRNFAIHGQVFAKHESLAPEALNGLRVGGHREYPPLVALNEALLFRASSDTRNAKPFFALAYLAYLLLVVEAVRRRLPTSVALALGTLFLCLPQAAYAAGSGMADLRLMASVLLLALEARTLVQWPSFAGSLRLGIFAGLCASTKNEGIAIAAITLASFTVWGLVRNRLTPATLFSAFAVCLALVGPWQYFKRTHEISERYLASAVEQSPIENLDRVLPIAQKFSEVALFPEQVGYSTPAFHWFVTLLVGAFALSSRSRRARTIPFALALAVHVALYAAVFWVTPREFDWHISSASERLLFHATPWLLMTCAAAFSIQAVGED